MKHILLASTFLMALAAAALSGFAFGVANTKEAWKTADANYLVEAKQQIQQAQQRSDTLTAELLDKQTQIDQLKNENLHAIQAATAGTQCLGAPAVRLLSNSPGITLKRLPTPGSSIASTHGTATPAPYQPSKPDADGTGIVTDTEITAWAVQAGAQFDTCRARLDALIDFHKGK